MSKIIYSASFLEFLKRSDCKIAKLLYSLHEKSTNWRTPDFNSLTLTDKEVNYLTFRNDGTISYLPAGKEHKVNDNGEWARENRQNGKPSKIIRKILAAKVQKYFKDSDFECFTNAYKASFNDDGYTFKLLSNKEIPNVYEMDRATGDGSLNNSCMNGDSEYLDIYKYCDKLQILILTDKDNKLCGRALVWAISKEIIFIDRFYVSQDFMYDKFLSYAQDKNWWRKGHYKTYDYKQSFVDAAGNFINKNFTIQTDTDHDRFPYIDTFQFGSDGSLNNFEDGDYTYNNTDGTRSGGEENHDGEVYDEINEEYIDEYSVSYITAGERCYRDRYCYSGNCVTVGDETYYEDDENIIEVDGNYYTKDDSDICEIDGEYYKMDDCIYCERDSCYYLCDDCVYCEDDEEDVLRSEAIEINDKWYHKESDKIVEIDGEFYEVDSEEIVKDENGNYTVIETIED